ncbi:hypothetical protein [Deinococcus navajonensis]|uniref:Uncharacterized protein n=1 Tax=Deinococcus navajonensis TaxID=309884 RepID=A0ABV8XL17_9DEIO
MTRPHDRDPLQEAEYLRRLALGILGTLEHKGLLSATEVNAILRAAQLGAGAPAPVTQPQAAPRPPAALGTQWVKPNQPYQPIDESTPIMPPKAVGPARSEQSPQPLREESGVTPVVPLVDITMD